MDDPNTLYKHTLAAFLAEGMSQSEAEECASDEMEDCGYVFRDGVWSEE